MSAVDDFIAANPGFSASIASMFPDQIQLLADMNNAQSAIMQWLASLPTTLSQAQSFYRGYNFYKTPFNFSIFNPTNYATTQNFNPQYLVNIFGKNFPGPSVPVNVTFDSRLIDSISASAFNNQTSQIIFSFPLDSTEITDNISVSISYNIKKSMQSILQLKENGVVNSDIDYDKLSQFNTYLNAYTKFKTQITTELQTARAHAADSLLDFQQRLASIKQQQQTYIQGLQLQIKTQLQSEAQSEKLAMSNAQMQLQSFALQLQGMCSGSR